MKEVSGVTNNLQFQTKHRTSNVEGGARASKFKGVVCQPNGQWGAQIYANGQRNWLGTFKSAEDAAMAYDSAETKHRTSSVGGRARASKFKGVVWQPNGQWGAQIYSNGQRKWLGTFKSAEDAAMAYDSAAMKF